MDYEPCGVLEDAALVVFCIICCQEEGASEGAVGYHLVLLLLE